MTDLLTPFEADLLAALELADQAARAAAVALLVKEQPRDERGRFASGGSKPEPAAGGGRAARGGSGRGSRGGAKVRASLARAKDDVAVSDAAEAEALAITGREIKFDLQGSDVQVAREHAEGVLRGLERYPGAALDRVHQGGDHFAEAFGLWAGTRPDQGLITFTDHAQSKGPAAYREVLKQAQAANHIVAGTPMGVAMHEFGHIVAEARDADGAAAAQATARSLAPPRGQVSRFVKTQVSARASEDPHELAAEAFADVMHNGVAASSTSAAIVDAVNGAYEDAAKSLTGFEADLAAVLDIADELTRAAALELLVKEQPRDDHGRFASTGDKPAGGAGRPSGMHDEATIRAAFGYHDPQTGMTAEVTTIRSSGPAQSTYVDIVIRDAAGNPVGEAVRTIRPANQRTVDHSGMALQPGMQGQGFAARFNAHAEEFYRANGIQQITVNANIDVGGYSHARAGYDFKNDSARAAAVVHMVTQPQYPSYPQSVRDQVNAAISNHNVTPIELAMIGYTPGATTWPGKEMLLGSMWEGVKRL